MNYIIQNFHKWEPSIQKYANGRLAVQYSSFDEQYGPELECTATINLPEENIAPDEVIIKDYSENEGIYQCMVAAGHISQEIRRVSSGFITAPVCRLLLQVQ